jgi:archaellin
MSGHTAIILIALVVGASVVAAGITIAHFPQNKAVDSNLKDTTFTCTNINLKVTVKVNLNNGMNSAEALAIGNKVFGYDNPASKPYHTEGKATVNEQGVWNVYYNWGSGWEPLSHYYFVNIYPSNQTFYWESCD